LTPYKDLLQAARSADPMSCPWGLYLSPASGEGDGLLWFASEAALLGFVRDGLWSALAGTQPDPATVQELREALVGPAPMRWDRLDTVNQLLEPVGQVHWWGSLRQLYEGEDPFAKDLREAWRDRAGRGPQDFSALSPDDARSFCDFLKQAF
jgi:hypothetical protein